jgi:thiamine biosynthesis lipoprotein ApbE
MRWVSLVLCVVAGAGGCRARARDATVTQVSEVMGTTLSVAAWGPDSTALRRAAARALDSVRRVDSLVVKGTRFTRPIVDQLRAEWTAHRPGRGLQPDWDDVILGYALDRAAEALHGVADSALLELRGQYLWVGPATRRDVGIADPRNNLLQRARVDLRSGSIRTLAENGHSVTVLGPAASDVAAWTTALLPMQCDGALALIQQGPPDLICVDSTEIRWSPRLEGRVAVPPKKRAP